MSEKAVFSFKLRTRNIVFPQTELITFFLSLITVTFGEI